MCTIAQAGTKAIAKTTETTETNLVDQLYTMTAAHSR